MSTEVIKNEEVDNVIGHYKLRKFRGYSNSADREIQFLKILCFLISCFLISENLIFFLIVLKWMYKEESLMNGGVR